MERGCIDKCQEQRFIHINIRRANESLVVPLIYLFILTSETCLFALKAHKIVSQSFYSTVTPPWIIFWPDKWTQVCTAVEKPWPRWLWLDERLTAVFPLWNPALLRIRGLDGKCAAKSSSSRVVCLPPIHTHLPVGLQCSVAGFGYQSEGEYYRNGPQGNSLRIFQWISCKYFVFAALQRYSQYLKQADVNLISQTVCKTGAYYGNEITDNMFCAGSPDWSTDACKVRQGQHVYIEYYLDTKNINFWRIKYVSAVFRSSFFLHFDCSVSSLVKLVFRNRNHFYSLWCNSAGNWTKDPSTTYQSLGRHSDH